MAENKIKQNEEQLKEEQLNEVSGGGSSRPPADDRTTGIIY